MTAFTKTEQAIIEILSDGEPHKTEEIVACLPDELGDPHNIQRHLTSIRKTIRLRGEDIICQRIYRWYFYRHIRHLCPPNPLPLTAKG